MGELNEDFVLLTTACNTNNSIYTVYHVSIKKRFCKFASKRSILQIENNRTYSPKEISVMGVDHEFSRASF